MRRLLIDSLERTPSPIEISNQKCQSTIISHYKSSPLTGSGIMAEPSRKIQRDELYELVWAKCAKLCAHFYSTPCLMTEESVDYIVLFKIASHSVRK